MIAHRLSSCGEWAYGILGLPRWLVVKNMPVNTGDIRDMGSIPRSRRSPGGGHGNPLQYLLVENPMDRGAWPLGSQRVGHD